MPDIPPYFKGEFFPALRRLNASPLNLTKINLKQIYRFLLEEITYVEEESAPRALKALRAELAHPQNEWNMVWLSSRQYMLGPALCSFLFKLLHHIIPTAERVSRILPNQSQFCTRCQLEAAETLHHALFDCPGNQGAGAVLHNGLKQYLPHLTTQMILNLDFHAEEEFKFPLVWTTATFLSTLWQLRVDKKRVELIKIRAEMEASCRLLRESRLVNTMEMVTKFSCKSYFNILQIKYMKEKRVLFSR